ncbi:MAG: hypothetical protein ACJ0GX_00890 [Parasynechococcus sp.]|uniref:hypothetical protein n=1 Tax=Parasynechococcus sp. TaxID=3101203 RepID=UPI003887353D
MLSSPFQQPSPRQNVLASQIQDAQHVGDERLLVLLMGQWVHRFGIDSLPVTHATSSEASVESFEQLQSDAVLNVAEPSEELVETKGLEASLDLGAQELEPPTQESWITPAVVAIHQISEDLAEAEADSEAEVTTFSEDLIVQELLSEEEFIKTPVEPARDQNVLVAMVPPPISTPRSLRRWLPRADQSFPQAS